jgi:hypothetical protein
MASPFDPMQCSLRIVTRYASVSDFIHGFCRSLDERHLLVGLSRHHAVGTPLAFEVCLVDGRPLLAGRGTIVELIHSRRRADVLGARVAVEHVHDGSLTMRRCLLLARQALLLTQAADAAAFDGDIPDFARLSSSGEPSQLALGTQPRAPTLSAYGEEPVSTMTSTLVAGVIFAKPTGALVPKIEVPAAPVAREDAVSEPAAPNLFEVVDTERVEALDPSALARPASRLGLLTAVLLLAVAATFAFEVIGYL